MGIIAFSGKKESGKTTAANDLVERLGLDYEIWTENFADYLKHIVSVCFFGCHYFEEEYKEQVVCGKTGREWLQIVGTDWFRNSNPDCWVNAYQNGLERACGDEIILTADVRFPNEVKCVQDLGGHVIRFLRNPHDDQHESETALDYISNYTLLHSPSSDSGIYSINEEHAGENPGMLFFDAMLDNTEMTIPEQNEAVWKLIQERGWLCNPKGEA